MGNLSKIMAFLLDQTDVLASADARTAQSGCDAAVVTSCEEETWVWWQRGH